MSTFPSGEDLWTFFIAPKLPTPLNYFPLVFRVLAILLAAPFAVGVALDLIAYAIARTLNISASSQRVPRSPPRVPRDLRDDEDENDWGVPSAFTSGLDSRQLSPKQEHPPLPAAPAPVPISRVLQFIGISAVLVAVGLQWISAASNANAQNALRLGANGQKPTALVLTAHPDDEVMFFSPTILNLAASGWGILAICLSEGNADGLGSIRREELFKSYLRLGVASDNVTIVNNPALQDSMDVKWKPSVIADIVSPYIARNDVTHLITFDHEGITQHPNHVSLSEVYPLLASPRPKLLELQSPSIFTKFTGPVWAFVLAGRDIFLQTRPRTVDTWEATETTTTGEIVDVHFTVTERPNEVLFVSSPKQYITALRAMLSHGSQLVWFRYLYIGFSHLMWANQLIEVTE